MQSNVENNTYTNDNLKCNHNLPTISDKNFLDGLRNARNILNDLDQCMRKTSDYEKKLLQCKARHFYMRANEFDEHSEGKFSKTGTKHTSTSRVDLAESWSTMSIVCLQYQHEELSKRYESLLQAYDERCRAVNARDAALKGLQYRTKEMRAELLHAHKVILLIGDKFLKAKHRRLLQKNEYEKTIEQLKYAVKCIVRSTERVSLELEMQIKQCMSVEQKASTALLLDEIRKCNILYLENLKLKAFIEQFMPGRVIWD